jgi:hypothetical protein
MLAVLTLLLLTHTPDPNLTKARALREAGDQAGVIELLTASYARTPKPRYLFEISQAHQALGHWVEAESNLQGALLASNDPWVKEYQAVLQDGLRKVKVRLGTIEIKTEPPAGVEVVLNGVSVGKTPIAPLRAVVGTAVLELRADGYVTVRRTVEVESQGVFREFFKLVPEARIEPAPPPPPVITLLPAPSPSPTPSPVSVTPAVPPTAKPSGGLPAGFWVFSGLAVVGLATGATFGILSNNDATRSNDIGCPSRSASDAECLAIQDDIATKRTVTGISLGVGGAAALSAVLVLILSGGPEPATTWVAPMAEMPGLVVGQRF